MEVKLYSVTGGRCIFNLSINLETHCDTCESNNSILKFICINKRMQLYKKRRIGRLVLPNVKIRYVKYTHTQTRWSLYSFLGAELLKLS